MEDNRIVLPDFKIETIDIDVALKEAELLCTTKVKHEPICLDIKQGNEIFTLGTFGNFSATVGVQKSRKTFAVCMLMAAAVNGEYEGIRSYCSNKQNLFFDTEQALYHAQKSNIRISHMSGHKGEHPINFTYFGLRKWNYKERLIIIEEKIKRTLNPGLIIIDGVRDLVSSVNDEQQATELISKLMQWTDERQCHINVIIHLKKGDFATPRGWLGTEIQNKAESVIEVRKCEKNPKTVSEILPRDMRGIEFDKFQFIIEDGLPRIIDEEEIKAAQEDVPY